MPERAASESEGAASSPSGRNFCAGNVRHHATIGNRAGIRANATN
jgi:hypothetical protein